MGGGINNNMFSNRHSGDHKIASDHEDSNTCSPNNSNCILYVRTRRIAYTKKSNKCKVLKFVV